MQQQRALKLAPAWAGPAGCPRRLGLGRLGSRLLGRKGALKGTGSQGNGLSRGSQGGWAYTGQVTATEVLLNDGTVIPYGIAVWAAGIGPLPLTLDLISQVASHRVTARHGASRRVTARHGMTVARRDPSATRANRSRLAD